MVYTYLDKKKKQPSERPTLKLQYCRLFFYFIFTYVNFTFSICITDVDFWKVIKCFFVKLQKKYSKLFLFTAFLNCTFFFMYHHFCMKHTQYVVSFVSLTGHFLTPLIFGCIILCVCGGGGGKSCELHYINFPLPKWHLWGLWLDLKTIKLHNFYF